MTSQRAESDQQHDADHQHGSDLPDDEHATDAHDDHTGGHDDHGDHAAMFRDRFWRALALTVPVVVWAPMIQEWFGYTAPSFPGSAWLAPVLGTPLFFYGGWPFLTGRWQEARDRSPRDDAADRDVDLGRLPRIAGACRGLVR